MSDSDSDSELNVKGLSQVLPYLWIGTADIAQDKSILTKLGITDILNLSSEDVDNLYESDFKYYSYPIDDLESYDISEHFDETYDIIADIKNNNKKLLVHDTSSKSISPTIVIAYMLNSAAKQDKQLTLKKAYDFVESKFIGIKPNTTFLATLIDLEDSLFGM